MVANAEDCIEANPEDALVAEYKADVIEGCAREDNGADAAGLTVVDTAADVTVVTEAHRVEA